MELPFSQKAALTPLLFIPLLHWWVTSFGVLGQWGPIDPQTSQAVAIASGYLPLLDPNTNDTIYLHHFTEHGEIDLGLTQKLHCYWLGFIVLEGTMRTTGGERQSSVRTTHKLWLKSATRGWKCWRTQELTKHSKIKDQNKSMHAEGNRFIGRLTARPVQTLQLKIRLCWCSLIYEQNNPGGKVPPVLLDFSLL